MNVLLLDDHPLVRSALESEVSALGAEVVVHAAATGEQANRILKEWPHPDLVLLDLGLPDIDGMQLLAQWRREYPDLRVVVVSAAVQPDNVIRALDEGARGFIPKLTSNEVLVQALRMVLAGGIYVPPLALQGSREDPRSHSMPPPGSLATHGAHERLRETALTRSGFAAADWTRPLQAAAVSAVPSSGPSAPSTSALRDPSTADAPIGASAASRTPFGARQERALSALPHLRLTARQAEVLQGLLQGQPNKLIARQLNLSVETVKDHVAALLRVLGVNSRTQAVLAVNEMLSGPIGSTHAAPATSSTTRMPSGTEGTRPTA